MINLFIQNDQVEISNIGKYVSNEYVCEPFNKVVVNFINDFSKELLNPKFRSNPELQALGYWFRNQKVNNFSNVYAKDNLPVGTVFHICPSNVDTIFVYSLFISLLMGNVNIVRLSSKESEAINFIISIFRELLKKEEYSVINNKIILMSYDRDDEITTILSSISNLRVFWGGATSISHLRKIPASSSTNDIYFPDRESICCINSTAFISLDDNLRLSLFNKFIADIKVFNQQACSSPLRLFWLGNKESFNVFLKQNELLNYTLELTHSELMDKFVSVSSMAIDTKDLSLLNKDFSKIIFVSSQSSLDCLDSHVGNGVVVVSFIENIIDIIPFISTKTQTLSQFGFEQSHFDALFLNLNDSQIDRVCKVGSSLEFDHIWDGKDLFLNFSRVIKVDL